MMYKNTDELFLNEGGDTPEARQFVAGNGYWYSPKGERFEEVWPEGWEKDVKYSVPLGYFRLEDGSGFFPAGHPVFGEK
jgi:hypothetical protein